MPCWVSAVFWHTAYICVFSDVTSSYMPLIYHVQSLIDITITISADMQAMRRPPCRKQCHVPQDACSQASYNTVHGRGSRAGHQLGVLHHPKYLPSAQSFSFLLRSCQLVWMGPLDLLEHSKQHSTSDLRECLFKQGFGGIIQKSA